MNKPSLITFGKKLSKVGLQAYCVKCAWESEPVQPDEFIGVDSELTHIQVSPEQLTLLLGVFRKHNCVAECR